MDYAVLLSIAKIHGASEQSVYGCDLTHAKLSLS